MSVIGPSVTGQTIKCFLDSRQCSMAGKHAYYRVLRPIFYSLGEKGEILNGD
jgi:hypothetical protein